MTQSNKKEEKEKQREAQKVEPASEKKSGGKTAEKLKFYGVVAFLSLLCAGFIWFIFKPDAPETVEGMAGINTTIPDAIAPETMADKQKAYELERQVKELNEKLERERKGQDPLELMEKSYEMAARYFPGQTGGQVKNIQPAGVTGGSSGNPAAIAAGRATKNVVSSLAVPPVPDTIPRNYGFATAVGGGQLAGANTIRACVAEDQTVTTGA